MCSGPRPLIAALLVLGLVQVWSPLVSAAQAQDAPGPGPDLPASLAPPGPGLVWLPRGTIPRHTRILAVRWYVPATSIFDQAQDISPDTAWARAIPLESLRLPMKALRVGGLSLGDRNYPLVMCLVDAATVPRPLAADALQPPALPLAGLPLAELPVREPDIVFTAFVGDLMLGRGVEQALADPALVFTDTLPLLQSADLLGGNLEGALTTRGTRTTKTYNFRFGPGVAAQLKLAGFDHVMVSNNHAWDYGKEGFLDTLAALEKAGLPWTGGGRDLEAARIPFWTAIKDQNFSVISLGAYPVESKGFNGRTMASAAKGKAGLLWADEANLQALQALYASDAWAGTVRMVQVHGGNEYQHEPGKTQRELYRRLVDIGHKLVVGSHPHVLQGFEVHDEGIIVHSLGNFVFPGMEGMPKADETLVLSLGWHQGQLVYFEPRGARLSGTTVKLDAEGRVLARWYKLSEALRK